MNHDWDFCFRLGHGNAGMCVSDSCDLIGSSHLACFRGRLDNLDPDRRRSNCRSRI
jgi:hypothetical protein